MEKYQRYSLVKTVFKEQLTVIESVIRQCQWLVGRIINAHVSIFLGLSNIRMFA